VAIVTLTGHSTTTPRATGCSTRSTRRSRWAGADREVRVVAVKGAGGVFSTGHDLGTAEDRAYRARLGAQVGIETFDQFKKYNLDLLLSGGISPADPGDRRGLVHLRRLDAGGGRWTWCSPRGRELFFQVSSSTFPSPGTSVWRRAKEVVFESRFLTRRKRRLRSGQSPLSAKRSRAGELRLGAKSGRETARSPADGQDSDEEGQDAQGFTRAVEDSLGD